MHPKLEAPLSELTFASFNIGKYFYNKLELPVISTGRSLAYYRRVFFNDMPASQLREQLDGKRVLDVGCGLTPYVSDSMFQFAQANGLDFFGIDPKLAEGFNFGSFDRLKVRMTGKGQLDPQAPGLDKALGVYANDIPLPTASVDLILSNYLIYCWIVDEVVLAEIFSEFARLLKTGGQVKIYPVPHMARIKPKTRALKEVFHLFDIEQEFSGELLRMAQYPPAYSLTLTLR